MAGRLAVLSACGAISTPDNSDFPSEPTSFDEAFAAIDEDLTFYANKDTGAVESKREDACCSQDTQRMSATHPDVKSAMAPLVMISAAAELLSSTVNSWLFLESSHHHAVPIYSKWP